MDRLGIANWAKYKALINDAHDTFNQETFVWYRFKSGLDRFGEDRETAKYDAITLKGLFDFNYFRKWPTVFTQPTGEIDRQTTVVILNVKYLRSLNLTTPKGRFDYDPALDRFEYDGIIYKAVSDTRISQAQDEPLLFDMLLEREELNTGENPYHAQFPKFS